MYTLNCKGRLLAIERPLIMGIINATPDSFYSGSRSPSEAGALSKVEEMLRAGADIIDVGGQSTRPGSDWIDVEEESRRVIPFVEILHRSFPEAVLSIDTFYSSIAHDAVAAGASIVNDISAGLLDPQMLTTVANLNVPYICMHMRGTPQTMQQFVEYDDMITNIIDYFVERISACRKAGIKDVIIDPGFGFSKTAQQNFQLLRELRCLQILDCPVLAGLSRKGTIYKTLAITADEALNGTTVMNTLALLNGASILRVHDVLEARQAATLVSEYTRA